MAKKGIYKVVFMQLGEVYEIYAESIYQSDMYGFIEVVWLSKIRRVIRHFHSY